MCEENVVRVVFIMKLKVLLPSNNQTKYKFEDEEPQ